MSLPPMWSPIQNLMFFSKKMTPRFWSGPPYRWLARHRVCPLTRMWGASKSALMGRMRCNGIGAREAYACNGIERIGRSDRNVIGTERNEA